MVRSALYLDFDNVFSGLFKLDPEAAIQFAEEINHTNWFGLGGFGSREAFLSNVLSRAEAAEIVFTAEEHQEVLAWFGEQEQVRATPA